MLVMLAMAGPNIQHGSYMVSYLIRCVIYHQVHDKPHASVVQSLDQRFNIRHGSIWRVNGTIVGNVIPHIDLWRFVDYDGRNISSHNLTLSVVSEFLTWAQPDDIHAEVVEIVQLGHDAGDIPNPVSIAVGKRGWVYLVD
jgi:hypothetical protein